MGWLSVTWWLVKNYIIYQLLSNILLYLLHIYISFFPILFHIPVEEVYECSIELGYLAACQVKPQHLNSFGKTGTFNRKQNPWSQVLLLYEDI